MNLEEIKKLMILKKKCLILKIHWKIVIFKFFHYKFFSAFVFVYSYFRLNSITFI